MDSFTGWSVSCLTNRKSSASPRFARPGAGSGWLTVTS